MLQIRGPAHTTLEESITNSSNNNIKKATRQSSQANQVHRVNIRCLQGGPAKCLSVPRLACTQSREVWEEFQFWSHPSPHPCWSFSSSNPHPTSQAKWKARSMLSNWSRKCLQEAVWNSWLQRQQRQIWRSHLGVPWTVMHRLSPIFKSRCLTRHHSHKTL